MLTALVFSVIFHKSKQIEFGLIVELPAIFARLWCQNKPGVFIYIHIEWIGWPIVKMRWFKFHKNGQMNWSVFLQRASNNKWHFNHCFQHCYMALYIVPFVYSQAMAGKLTFFLPEISQFLKIVRHVNYHLFSLRSNGFIHSCTQFFTIEILAYLQGWHVENYPRKRLLVCVILPLKLKCL